VTSVDDSVSYWAGGSTIAGELRPKPTVLIVDDDKNLQDLMVDFLRRHGIKALSASNGVGADRLIGAQPVDVVVLDAMLAGEDGLSICRRLAARPEPRPGIIMLSEAADETDRIVGLEIGADDYLSKPANPRELLARIRAVLRRFAQPKPEAAAPDVGYEFSGWSLSVWTHELKDPDGRPVPLTTSEFALLRAFLDHPRRVLTRDQLLTLARGRESFAFDRAVDVQVSRLRRRFAAAGRDHDELVRTVRNEGYMFVASVKRA
jgi:two-component system OmpR family response regulator